MINIQIVNIEEFKSHQVSLERIIGVHINDELHQKGIIVYLNTSGPSAIDSDSIQPNSVLHSGLKREW